MQKFKVEDPESGSVLVMEGDSAPTEQEISEAFSASRPKPGGFRDLSADQPLKLKSAEEAGRVVNPQTVAGHIGQMREPVASGVPAEDFSPSSVEGIELPEVQPQQFNNEPGGNYRPPTAQYVAGGGPMAGLAFTPSTKGAFDPLVALPKYDTSKSESIPGAVAKEGYNLLAGLPEIFASPGGLTTTALAPAAPIVAELGFAGMGMHGLVNELKQSSTDWSKMTAPQKAAAITRGVGAVAMFGLPLKAAVNRIRSGKPLIPVAVQQTLPRTSAQLEIDAKETPNATENQEPKVNPIPAEQGQPAQQAAAVPPEERAAQRPGEGQADQGEVLLKPGETPAAAPETPAPQPSIAERIAALEADPEVTGAEGRATNAKKIRDLEYLQQTQAMEDLRQAKDRPASEVPLDDSAEAERLAIDEADKAGSPAKVVDSFGGETDTPFAGGFMRATPEGIEINRGEFSKWLASIQPGRRAEAIKARINEEHIHRHATAGDAAAFYQDLTPLERTINFRRYTGHWTPEALQRKRGAAFSDTQLGHEALRYRMQQLMELSPSEVAEAAGRERWTLAALDVVDGVVKRARQALGTEASGRQLAILDRVSQNLKIGRAVLNGASPMAYHQPIEIEHADGTREPGTFDGYWDLREVGGEVMPTISRRIENGMTTGMLRPGEKIVGSVPTFDEWDAAQRQKEKLPTAAFKQAVAIEGKDHPGIAAKHPELLPEIVRDELRLDPKAYDEELPKAFRKGEAEPTKRQEPEALAGDIIRQMRAEADQYRQAGDVRGAEELEAQADALAKKYPRHEEGSFPAAFNKFGRPEEEDMFGAAARGGRLTRPEIGGSAEDLSARLAPEAVTASEVEAQAAKHLAESSVPSFKDFSAAMTGRHGIKPGQLRDVWQDQVWRRLMTASGTELRNMVRGLGLEKPLRVTDSEGRLRDIPDATGEQAAEASRSDVMDKASRMTNLADRLEAEAEQMTPDVIVMKGDERLDFEARIASKKARAKSLRSRAEQIADAARRASPEALPKVKASELTPADRASQNYRSNVIATIGNKLIRESIEERGPKTITVDDLASRDDEHQKQPIFQDIRPDDAKNPETLGRVLTEDARGFGGAKLRKVEGGKVVEIKQKGEPVSTTRRLTAIQDRAKGTVYLVGTYRDGRRGCVLHDPKSPDHASAPLESILQRYRVIGSVLSDSYTKKFVQEIGTLKEWEEGFATEARKIAQEGPGEPPAVVEGEFAASPSGGRAALPGAQIEAPGVFSRLRKPLTAPEAASIMDLIDREAGDFTGPEDFLSALSAIREFPQENTLARVAIAKLAKELERLNPELSTEDLLNKLAKDIYEDHQTAQSREEFQSRTMAKGPSEDGGPPRAPVQARQPKAIEGPRGAVPSVEAPQAFRKGPANDLYEQVKDAAHAFVARHETAAKIPVLLDSAAAVSRRLAQEAKTHIINASENPLPWRGLKEAIPSKFMERRGQRTSASMVREAALALVHSGEIDPATGDWAANRSKLPKFYRKLEIGELKAKQLALTNNPLLMIWGKKWLRNIERLRKGLDYADAHWNDLDLQDTAFAVQKELADAIAREQAAGSTVAAREGYFPGRWEGEFWADHTINFRGLPVLGKRFRDPKKFATTYDAAAVGPYIPRSYDTAEVVGHRVHQGAVALEGDVAWNAMKQIQDPISKAPIAKEPRMIPAMREVDDPANSGQRMLVQDPKWAAPSPEYVLVTPRGYGKPLAVRRGYDSAVNAAMAVSKIDEIPLGREALMTSQALKHGALLLWDSFHLGRIAQYGAAVLGKDAGYRGGFAALSYRPADLATAVANGQITPEAARWAMETSKVKVNGRYEQWTNRDILLEGQKHGLNISNFTDALYRDAVQNVPFVGERIHKLMQPYNNFLFQRFMPGIMANSFVTKFKEYHAANPTWEVSRLMRDVARDTNINYGNLGRQGWIKSATGRDLAQIFLLAPMWQEGLVRRELTSISRIPAAVARSAGLDVGLGRRGLPALGMVGQGMVNGLLFYFAATQALNMLTRGKPTWQNPEENHKLDAYVPTPWLGKGTGFFISPMSVFAEVTHDILRLRENKGRTDKAIGQMISNRSGPVGRAINTLLSGEDERGQAFTSTSSRLTGSARQLAPVPISFGTPTRAIANAIAPEYVSPPQRGALGRQLVSSLGGIKAQASETPGQQVQRLAANFVEESGLKRKTGWQEEQTEDPSYSKLRAALRNNDQPVAKQIYRELLKDRTPRDIDLAMRQWSRTGFTRGNKKVEAAFKMQLTPAQQDLYFQAVFERMEENQNYLNWRLTQH